MKISTRGRYALRAMVDLAESALAGPVALKDISSRQEISRKYLEGIMSDLVKSGIVLAQKGKGGGYMLAKAADEIAVGDVLRVTEGDLAPVSCLEKGAVACPRSSICRTLPMWREFEGIVNGFFGRITIADLMRRDEDGFDYVI